MKKDIYTDGIMNMGFGNGAVRLDLGRLGETQGDSDQPSMEFVKRLVMTPEGFVQALGAMNAMAKQLADNGVLKMREGEPQAKPTEKVKSVNFS